MRPNSMGPATGQDYWSHYQLKKTIQEHLGLSGIQDERAKSIIQKVIGDHPYRPVTRLHLRQIINEVEKTKFRQEYNKYYQDIETLCEKLPSGVLLEVQKTEDVIKQIIQSSNFLLKETPFDCKEVSNLREIIIAAKIKMEVLAYPSPLTGPLYEIEEQFNPKVSLEQNITLSPETLAQLQQQIKYLSVKEKMLSQYLESNPFSDKNVQYPRRIYAEAVKLLIDDKIKNIKEANITDDPFKKKVEKLELELSTWHAEQVNNYENINSEAMSYDPEFYLNKKNRDNPLVKYNAKYAISKLQQLLENKGLSEDFLPISQKDMEKAAATAMNTILPWKIVERDMVFSLNGKTGVYRTVTNPLSRTDTAVGEHLRKKGIGGIIPAVRNGGEAPINARMTELYKIEYTFDETKKMMQEKKTLLYEKQLHGINDHFAIPDHQKRLNADVDSMRQLIQSGAEADPGFIQEALKPLEKDQKPVELFYINMNLTTPTWTPRGDKNNEYLYSEYQATSMKTVEERSKLEVINNEKLTFSVLNPNKKTEEVDIQMKVTCIDFRFPVNYAISDVSEDKKALDPGMLPAWGELKRHNAREFEKLRKIINTTLEKLDEKIKSGETEEAYTLKKEIDTQSDYIKEMLVSEKYKRVEGDRFKMPRHVDLLANLLRQASKLEENRRIRVVNAGGCMSGKDRQEVANADTQAAIIIQNLGGKVQPGQGVRTDDETKAIYDFLMTLTVDNTRQVTGIGGSKNANEITAQMSNFDSKKYSQGGGGLVKS